MEAVSDQQVWEKNPFGLENVYYKCLNLLMAIASNGYGYFTCKLNFQKEYLLELVGKCCPVSTIQNKFSLEELEEMKYSRVKLLILYNKLFKYVEMAKEKDACLNDFFSIEYEYKFKDFSSGYNSSLLSKNCNKLY